MLHVSIFGATFFVFKKLSLSLILYMVMFFLLPLTQLTSQLSTKISTNKISKSAIYTTKMAQRLLVSVLLHRQHLYRASTPRVPIFVFATIIFILAFVFFFLK